MEPRRQRMIEKFFANPPIRLLLRLGIAPKAFVLLETTGRRSGLPRQTPVNNGLVGNVCWIVAGRGRRAAYVQNLLADPRVRIKVRRTWRTGTAMLVDDDTAARRHWLDHRNGLIGRLDAIAFHASSIPDEMTTIRVELDPHDP